jgi:hypothetical protein
MTNHGGATLLNQLSASPPPQLRRVGDIDHMSFDHGQARHE